MSTKADSRLAEFLRRVQAGDDGAAPVDVIFGQGAATDEQQSLALQFAFSIRDMGYIESTGGPGGDLHRVRVTPQGREWLDEFDQRAPTLHPRYSS
jgi:hypothetical protein